MIIFEVVCDETWAQVAALDDDGCMDISSMDTAAGWHRREREGVCRTFVLG